MIAATMISHDRTIASYLHDHLVATGLTEVEAADMLGVDQTQVSRWRRGQTVPRRGNLEALAELLDVDVDDLERARDVSEALRAEVAERGAVDVEAELARTRAELRKAAARIKRLEERLRRVGG